MERGVVPLSRNHHLAIMCGRVIQSSAPIRLAIDEDMDVRDSRVHNYPPRWNAAPSQEVLVIRRNHQTGKCRSILCAGVSFPTGERSRKADASRSTPNARPVHKSSTFRDRYRRRRCIVPVDGFFEWTAIKGSPKQPYAIAMKNGSPVGIGGL